ncbi:hypothetical protein GCM10023232_12350 [Sphingosinicella ginsenosidimutans]|uniref:DUF6456 domain-containing protein n=1 Tax=Allosphingosinicella ginsenosidimutans TaxID=1176539 RepID=A0A5C6TQ71_9SPHN|nr:DUF6456 domain-containing protein [Sphingosinicella ginsenosidimutans]TXC62340.1 hypothetical protein FRZ32_00915 [Sphingosinicella ginsenosidimutans]
MSRNRILVERPLPRDGARRTGRGARLSPSAPRTVTVNLAESPLGWLRARGLVSRRQFDAGETLRADWERAQLDPAVTMRWDASPKGRRGAARDPAAATDAQLAAKRRFEAAAEAVGAGLGDILWRIVCAGEGMREAERALGWPARAGRLVLGIALDRLADHYRIPRS